MTRKAAILNLISQSWFTKLLFSFLFFIYFCYLLLYFNHHKILNAIFSFISHSLLSCYLRPILSSCPTPITLLSSIHFASSTRLFHAAFHLSTPLCIFFHQPNKMCLVRVFYHFDTSLHTFDHQPIKFCHTHASYCAASLPNIFCFSTKHTILMLLYEVPFPWI